MPDTWKILIEVFGYIGSTLVVVSMLMTSVMKLRIINTIGSVVSFIYAMICQAYPIAIMNLCLVIINLYNLRKLGKDSPEYHLEIGKAGDPVVEFMIGKYKQDMRSYFSAFKGSEEGQTAYIVMNGDVCVGLALGTVADGHLNCTLDYTTPSYRDFSIGAFLYEELKEEHGIKSIGYCGPAGEHKSYLERMNFVEKDGKYIKTL